MCRAGPSGGWSGWSVFWGNWCFAQTIRRGRLPSPWALIYPRSINCAISRCAVRRAMAGGGSEARPALVRILKSVCCGVSQWCVRWRLQRSRLLQFAVRVLLYTGSVKSWSIVSPLQDLGMKVVATGTKKSTEEDKARIRLRGLCRYERTARQLALSMESPVWAAVRKPTPWAHRVSGAMLTALIWGRGFIRGSVLDLPPDSTAWRISNLPCSAHDWCNTDFRRRGRGKIPGCWQSGFSDAENMPDQSLFPHFRP